MPAPEELQGSAQPGRTAAIIASPRRRARTIRLTEVPMQSRDDPVLLSVQDGVEQVRFNRPATLNAIDQPLAVSSSRVRGR